MHHFAQLVAHLDQTNTPTATVRHFADFLSVASDADKLWAMALFTGRRPRRLVKTSLLREWTAELTHIPLWLVEESYHIVGDLAETLSLLLPNKESETKPEEATLDGWMRALQQMQQLEEPECKAAIQAAWGQMSQQERFVFNKLITGGFRLGVSQKLLVRALAKHTAMDENQVAHRLMGNWTAETTTYQELLFSENAGDNLSKPYPFYLAYALENEASDLGNPTEWQAEWKWDGIRSQLIRRGGEHFLWSRGEELITDKFPELEPLVQRLPDGCVIDGELLAFRDGRPLSFQLLQTRISRKRITAKILKEAPCAIYAYDLLEWEGEDIRSKSMAERRELLANLVEEVGLPSLLRLSPEVEFQHWETLVEAREHSRAQFAEGLMLKRRDSDYKVGRKKGDWWKWKVDPYTIDAVMIYAQRGHGRRANLFSDYTFAVWDGDTLVPFAKAYSGLTDAEMRKVDSWVKRNTRERFGPVRSVVPELVFEIGFEGINRSTRHKSGIALRFPRMLRWRTDKPASEANTLADLQALLPDS